MRTQKTTLILSPQQLNSCASGYGCDYGWTETAFEYVRKTGGIDLESDYPYTSYDGVTGRCNHTNSDYVATVIAYLQVEGDRNETNYTRSVETNMANYVKSTGTLSVCLNALNWNTYTGGILVDCAETSINHCKYLSKFTYEI